MRAFVSSQLVEKRRMECGSALYKSARVVGSVIARRPVNARGGGLCPEVVLVSTHDDIWGGCCAHKLTYAS